MNKGFALMGVMIILVGCAGTFASGPKFTEAPPPPGQKALLYIYRGNTPLMWTPTIKIDDRIFAQLGKMGYSYTYISPGVHRLGLHYGGLKANPFFSEFLIKEGQVAFKRIYDSGGFTQIMDVAKERALDEITEYKYVEPSSKDF